MLTGMIFQYNNEEGSGRIMLSTGSSKEFSVKNWIDTSCEPSVGAKVTFEGDAVLTNIQVLTDESISIVPSKQGKSKSSEPKTEEFSSVDEYIEHFKALGYKLAKDKDDGTTRTASLRIFTEDGHAEIIISATNGKISVTKMVNGKQA